MQINKLCRLARASLTEHLYIQYHFYQLKSIKNFDIGFTIRSKKNKIGPNTAEVYWLFVHIVLINQEKY